MPRVFLEIEAAAWLYARRQRPSHRNPIRYVDSPRHALEVEHYSYRKTLERIVESLARRRRRSLVTISD